MGLTLRATHYFYNGNYICYYLLKTLQYNKYILYQYYILKINYIIFNLITFYHIPGYFGNL